MLNVKTIKQAESYSFYSNLPARFLKCIHGYDDIENLSWISAMDCLRTQGQHGPNR